MKRQGYLLCVDVAVSCLLLLLDISQGQVHEGPGKINRTAKENWIDKLRKDLLDGYDKHALPLQNLNQTITVQLGIALISVDVDEKKSRLSADIWIRMVWIDNKLSWDADAYGGLDVIRMADHELWRPDVTLYNSADLNNMIPYDQTHMLLYPNGEVLWVPPAHYDVLCEMNFLHWPWEDHNCTMKFGSWVYDGHKLDFKLYNEREEIDVEDYLINNTKWEVVETSARKNTKYYDCCEEPYTDITFSLKLRRRSPTYRAVLTAPVIVVVAVTLFSFWLPPMASERITIAGFNFLILSIYLHWFGNSPTERSDHTPIIVAFYSTTAVMVGVSIIFSVISISICREKRRCAAPRMIKQTLSGLLGKLLLLGCYVDNVPDTHSTSDKLELTATEAGPTSPGCQKPNKQPSGLECQLPAQNDWILVAAFFNRIIFLVYCVVFGVTMAECF